MPPSKSAIPKKIKYNSSISKPAKQNPQPAKQTPQPAKPTPKQNPQAARPTTKPAVTLAKLMPAKQAHMPSQKITKPAVLNSADETTPRTTPLSRTKTAVASGTVDPLNYLTPQELDEIDRQFALSLDGIKVVLFWTGVECSHVQRWAKLWGLKTLTIAMGPLMDPGNLLRPRNGRSKKAYSRYVKGASIRFARYACQHCRVIVLTNPPPNIYSTRENNTYQCLEEPILKGLCGGSAVRRIDYIHPPVTGAAHVTYQVWPHDKSQDWAVPFSVNRVQKWKGLNWSYHSLITTSQICLEASRKHIKAGALISGSRMSGSKTQLGLVPNIAPGSSESPNLITSNTNEEQALAETIEIPRSEEGTVDSNKHKSLPVFGAQSRETQAYVQEISYKRPTGTVNTAGEAQNRNQTTENIGYREFSPPLTLAYTIKRCHQPFSSVTVPAICIDDIAPGKQVTFRLAEKSTSQDFLYLFMKSKHNYNKWWKVSWLDVCT